MKKKGGQLIGRKDKKYIYKRRGKSGACWRDWDLGERKTKKKIKNKKIKEMEWSVGRKIRKRRK
jgi:hypothetical protein